MNQETNEQSPVDLVEYKEGSVVSKTLLKKETGTISLFAFDHGQGLSEHTVPFDAMVYILDGSAEVTISGDPIIVNKNKMIIMPANEPHSLKAIKKFKMMLIMIKS